MQIDAQEQIEKFKEFLEANYKKHIHELITKGKRSLVIDFSELAQFDLDLADQLLNEPEETIKAAELSIDQLNLPEETDLRVRFQNLPDSQHIMIRDIRSEHLDKFLSAEGIVRQASDVRPQVVSARFECPSCGNTLSILQLDAHFKEPSRCSCGRRGHFRLLSKDLVDAQRLVIEEAPESLEGGEQPKRISVFLKEDLVEPKMEKKTTPGSKVKINGIVKEVPILLRTGAQSIRYDLMIESNYIESVEQTFEQIELNDEDLKQIKELSQDSKVYEKFIGSIAPSIYGHEDVKEALLLQLLGGVKKAKSDGTIIRGDMHILLVGDPGSAKSTLLMYMSKAAPKARYVSGKGASLDYSEPLLIRKNGILQLIPIGRFVDEHYIQNCENLMIPLTEFIETLVFNKESYKIEWKPIKCIFRHRVKELLYKFILETGRQITVTGDHSIFILDNGQPTVKAAKDLICGDCVLIPRKIQHNPPYYLSIEAARLIGYYIAEGHTCNRDGSYKIEFTLNKNESYIIEEIKQCAKVVLKSEAKVYPHGENGARVIIYGKNAYMIFAFLLGEVIGKKAKEKRIPLCILNAQPEARHAFIEAYIKGDGGVTKSYMLMSDLLYLFLQDDTIASVNQRREDKKIITIKQRIINSPGYKYELKSPKIRRKYNARYTRPPFTALSKNLLNTFFKSAYSSDYKRASEKCIGNKLLSQRLESLNSTQLYGKEFRKLFGECSLEYVRDHKEIFKTEKDGREILITLSEKGKGLFQSINCIKKLIDSDIGFVRIKKIEQIPATNNFVYDISVPGYENFIGGFGGIICHNSGAGITASVVKDEFLRGWALEAGALVLANGGLLCIDELDKMSTEDRSAMHEALEQQRISISKANIQACYSSDTEVLTEDGWKRYLEVKDSRIAQFDSLKKTIKFLPHNGLFIYDYKGKMYNFVNKRMDILITPNHKMLAREYSQKNYRVIEAEKLRYNYIKFLNSGNFIGKEKKYFILPPIKHQQNRKHPKYTHQHKPKKIPMDLWLEFLGYYLTEGGIQKKPTIGIPQKNKGKINKIKKCLSRLAKYIGFALSETKDKIYIRFQITNTQLFEFLEKNCGKKCFEKKYNLKLSSLSKRQLKILYTAMMLGDGSSDEKYFSSSSSELIDLFQIVACLIGKSTNKNIHYKEKTRGNRRTQYRVSLCNRIEPSIRKKKIRLIDYNGKVFCFSTETGFFVTRRNGKITIQGNTLKAETTVLAAANPKFGRFDPYAQIASQIDLPPTLINRFDLIFPIRDIPSKEMDEKIAKHVLSLQQKPTSMEPEIPISLFKKYIAYAKQNIHPKLSNHALEEIKTFYVNLRNLPTTSNEGLKPVPISARQLEALVRLAEGSARVRLSNTVTRKDAAKAISLLKNCLIQIGFDYETGQIDIDRISTGIPASQRNKLVIIRDIINELGARGKKSIPIEEIITEAAEKDIKEDIVEEIIEKMKRSGDIFEPKRGFISKI